MKKLALGFVFLLALRGRSTADGPAIGLADLEAYHAALSARPDESAPLVGFRELWEHPEAHTGQMVRVEGRLARIFRQPRIGDFPPLAEAWVVSPAGDPFCLVFPPGEGRSIPEVGAPVRFSGTFLRRIKYHGGDTDRLAPLIVGPSIPTTLAVAPVAASRPWSRVDWMMAVGASLVVAVILARRHLTRPEPAPPALDPPPLFEDGGLETPAAHDEGGNSHEVA